VWSGELAATAATALARSGRIFEARRIAAELADNIAGCDAPHAAACELWCRGALAEAAGRLDEAAERYREADRRLARLPRPYAATQAADASARCLLAAGQPATALLIEMAERSAALGAVVDAASCHRLLLAYGAPAPQRRGRRGYGDQLSPREREVARLLALGRTDREIATLLFLSPRTIEQHVAKVLRKLGVESRGALAAPS
jgi:DNA-binding CsgD family transcriptional regulator